MKGVDGVDVVIGTSSFLRDHSHGKDMTYIRNTAIEVIQFVKSKGYIRKFRYLNRAEMIPESRYGSRQRTPFALNSWIFCHYIPPWTKSVCFPLHKIIKTADVCWRY